MRNFIILMGMMILMAGCDDMNCHDCSGSGCGSGECSGNRGDYCDFNRDCASNQCVNHVCRSVSNSTVGDPRTEPGGMPGNSSGAGSSGAGSSGAGSSGAGSSGAGSSGAGNGLASGSACFSHQECESGLCYEGFCSDDCDILGCFDSNMVCRYNRCIPIATDGGECSYEVKYGYHNVDREYRIVDIQMVGCKDYEYCCNGFCTEDKCEPRISCKIGDQCKSGQCYDYINDIRNERTVCGCSYDEECGTDMYCSKDSDYLVRYSIYDDSYYLVNSSAVYSCQAKLKVGASCTRDAMCKLGACYDGKCVEPKNAEQRCDSDGDCATRTCGQSSYEDGDREDWESCHADGQECELPSYCEEKYDDGENCYQNENCKSGICSEKYGVCGSVSKS